MPEEPTNGENPGDGEQGNWFTDPADCDGWAEQAKEGHTRCCYAGEGDRAGQAIGIDMEGPGPC